MHSTATLLPHRIGPRNPGPGTTPEMRLEMPLVPSLWTESGARESRCAQHTYPLPLSPAALWFCGPAPLPPGIPLRPASSLSPHSDVTLRCQLHGGLTVPFHTVVSCGSWVR